MENSVANTNESCVQVGGKVIGKTPLIFNQRKNVNKKESGPYIFLVWFFRWNDCVEFVPNKLNRWKMLWNLEQCVGRHIERLILLSEAVFFRVCRSLYIVTLIVRQLCQFFVCEAIQVEKFILKNVYCEDLLKCCK